MLEGATKRTIFESVKQEYRKKSNNFLTLKNAKSMLSRKCNQIHNMSSKNLMSGTLSGSW